MFKRLLATCLFLLSILPAFTQEVTYDEIFNSNGNRRKIFITYSNEFNKQKIRDFTAGFSSYISTNKLNANFKIFCTDPIGYESKVLKNQRISKALKIALSNNDLGIIICLDTVSLNLILDNSELLPPTTPIISCNTIGTQIKKHQKISEVATALFFEDNFKLGMKFFPKTEEVLILTDDSSYGDVEQKVAKIQLAKYQNPNLKIKYMSPKGMTYSQYLDSINSISTNSFIILSSWLMDADGFYPFNNEYKSFLKRIKSIPIFGCQNNSLNSGIIGGYLVSTWGIGYDIANKSNELIVNKKTSAYDTIRKFELVFDFKIMQRWGIPIESLPKGSKIINKPPNLFEDYKKEVYTAIAAFILLLSSLIVFTVYHIRYRKLNLSYKELYTENEETKNILTNTFSVMKEGVVTINIEGKIVNTNKSAESWSTSSTNIKIGQDFNDIFHFIFSDTTSIQQLVQLCNTSKKRIAIPDGTKLKLKDSYISIEGDISPILDNAENVNNIVFVIRDISELNRQKSYLNLALESADSYTWFLDISTKTLQIGDNHGLIFGSRLKKQSNYTDFLSLIHPEDRTKIEEWIEKLATYKDDRFSFEYRIDLEGKGQYQWWEKRGYIQSIPGETNVISALYGMDINISNHKQREAELIDARNRAEESDKLKSSFLSNMSHEIRTPLNGIIGFTNLLIDPDYSDNDKKEFIKLINTNSRVLMTLISDILDLSKIESNSMNFEIEPLDINSQITEIVSSYEHSIPETLKIDLDIPKEAAYIDTDYIRNRQILTNLINNSIKFTDSGTITVGYKKSSTEITIFVKDTGKGIDKEHLEKIFMRFFKVDDFTVGTGLGLSICRAIVEKLGGKIWAESEQGKGTTMYYTLPVNNHNKEVVIMDDIKKEQDIPEKHPIMSSEQNMKTILIAEDIETNYHLLKVILSKKYNLLRAVNGSEAVNLFIEHKPDLILMDIKMPIMNGLDATREIRKISNDVVIIAQTANAFESDVELAKDAGCNDFITKPIRHKDLLAIIEKHLI